MNTYCHYGSFDLCLSIAIVQYACVPDFWALASDVKAKSESAGCCFFCRTILLDVSKADGKSVFFVTAQYRFGP